MAKFTNDLSPADFYITKTEEEPAPVPAHVEDKAPGGYKLNPKYIEKYSNRVQLLFQPSVLRAIDKAVKKNGYKSRNEFINYAVKEKLGIPVED